MAAYLHRPGMTQTPFTTPIETTEAGIAGPWRTPHNMLAEQTYDDHTSIHDDATAQKMGFKGGAVEGPTHFSQTTPLAVRLFGPEFFEKGCLSAHYRAIVYDGEQVQAHAAWPEAGAAIAPVWMIKRDGTEVQRGTASFGDAGATALDRRLGELAPLADPVITRDITVGYRTGRQTVRMDPDQNMGALYPFSLNQKLEKITEPSAWYAGGDNPFGRAIIPFEMISVLLQYTSREDRLPTKGPALGLFADQEVRLIHGPLFVGETYEVEREVVAITGSRRTESLWVRSEVFHPGEKKVIASMLLNHAILKESYASYAEERAALYPV
ncbi:MAG TPA: hypothetical protein VFN88_01840 [Caulobacteraceae bacterium]|nr:hypothetical protein [Caulobacteraceae bacterium]